MKNYCIGVDFGGTAIKMGLINAQGKIIDRCELDTKSFEKNKTKLIKALVTSIERLYTNEKLKKSDILGVGIGMPGLIDVEKGFVKVLPNVPGWRNVPLKALLTKELKLPIFVDNDVNLMTLGEWKYGSGKGFQNILCLTLGTGVGGGLILNNAIYRGPNFAAGEIGHMPLNEKGPDCNCGSFACFECYVGNTQLMAKAGKIFKNKNMKMDDVFDLANQGNVRAEQFWAELATNIGNALVGVVNLLNPQVVIIGGGISGAYKYIGKPVNQIVKKRCMQVQADNVKIVKAKLGNDAGIIGARVLIQDHS